MKIEMADGSGFRDYRYLHADKDRHGNTRIYFRRKLGAPKIRLLEKPGTEEFDKEYQDDYKGGPARAVSSAAAAIPGSLKWLCQKWYASGAFKTLDETTQRARRNTLDAICATPGKKTGRPLGDIQYISYQARDIAALRDQKVEVPEAANMIVKAFRALFVWACDPENNYAHVNPARDVKFLASKNPGGHKPWSQADIEKYEKRHPLGTQARLAFDLLRYTGVRRSDVVRLGPQMEQWFEDRDGSIIQAIVFVEFKGRKNIRKEHCFPILTPLRESIDATPSGQLTYLVTEFGRPRSAKAFGNWFKARCREAGVDPELSAHGVRKFVNSNAAELGATAHELMAMSGWRSIKEAQRYTEQVDRRRLEIAGVRRLGTVVEQKLPHLQKSGEVSGKKARKINGKK